MQTVLSEKTIGIKYRKDIELSAFLFEEFAQLYGIPNVVVNQVRLILSELLSSIRTHNIQHNNHNAVSLTFKLFKEGSLSIKITHRGQAYNPFEEDVFGGNRFVQDFRINTLGFHLARKYMDVSTYHRSLDYNVIYIKKEQV
jgi:anti-sigma regulatory factor (Ser/Thr protein kinase)